MKNIIKSLLLISLSLTVWSCTNEDVVVHYPASTPKIDTAIVAETQITYGDSIHVKVAVSDKVEPLSTLLLKVVVSNEVISTETIRTKGNAASIEREIAVPFGPNRPDNEPVKVYLTLTNVEGFTRDSIISTTIAKRPVGLDVFYLVPDFGQGATVKLTLTDPAKLIYTVAGLQLKNSFSYKIATKIDKFKRIDWSGYVFGKVENGIGLISSTGESLTSTDATLVGISEFTFDALMFTTKVAGKLLEPAKTLDIDIDLPALTMGGNDFKGGNIYFGENVEVTFTGITDLANNLSPDYFQVTGTNTAKFLGKTGLYKAYYLISAGYLYIEPQPEATYPDVLWICGVGFGRPQSPYATTASWNWNSPLDYAPCRQVSPGVYQVTVYLKNEATTAEIGSLNFKFFDYRGWDHGEELSTSFTVSAPLAASSSAGNVGNTTGLSSNPFEGVYRITLNKNDNTIKAEKKN